MKSFCLILVLAVLASCTHSKKIYVVRHAEKAAVEGGMSATDPELSEAGKLRAAELAIALRKRGITAIYVTSTIRSKSTAEPTAAVLSLTPVIYRNATDSAFLAALRSAKGSVLVVAHSNTVAPLINKLTSSNSVKADLAETSFDRLFIVTLKKGGYSVTEERYGKPTP